MRDIQLIQQLAETDIWRAMIDDDAHGAVGGMRAHIDDGARETRVSHRRHRDQQLAVEIAFAWNPGLGASSRHDTNDYKPAPFIVKGKA
jgi:cobalamin biosynthesis protein CobT